MDDQTGQTLAELQHALLGAENLEQFLHELAVTSAGEVAEGLCCAMTFGTRGRPPATAACSDPLAAKIGQMQCDADAGPCLHAMRLGHPVHIRDTSRDNRWPRFAREAAALGIRSGLCLPLAAGGEPVGTLAWYGRFPGAFGAAQTRRAAEFAGHASGALALALRHPLDGRG